MKTPRQIILPLVAALGLCLAPLPAGPRSQGCDLATSSVPAQTYSATARKACAIYLNLASAE
jgi:hypothetical protein